MRTAMMSIEKKGRVARGEIVHFLRHGYVRGGQSIHPGIHQVEPGEIVTLTAGGLRSRRFVDESECRRAHCIFEHVYFARPDSRLFGKNVHRVRMRLGEHLAREHGDPEVRRQAIFWLGQTDTDESQYIANAPRAVLCRQWDWTFGSGQEVKRTFGIFMSQPPHSGIYR